MHLHRSDKLIRMALQRTKERGHASEILNHKPASPSPEEQEILDLAKKQLEMETSILHMNPTRRRSLIRRRMPLPGFEFDLAESSETPATKNSDISKLIGELDFESAAAQFLARQNRFSLTPELIRSIQHLLVQVEPTHVKQVRTPNGEIDLVWSWPNEPAVNAAVATGIFNNEVVFRNVLPRRASPCRATIKPRLAKTTDKVAIQWALVTDSGAIVTPSQKWNNKQECEITTKSTQPQTQPTPVEAEIVLHQRPARPQQPVNYGFQPPRKLSPTWRSRLRHTPIGRLAVRVISLLRTKVPRKP
jgi:hypothetical protein